MANRELKFGSRRPSVLARHGAVACTDTRAAQIGLDTLRAGGNAADAAVAVAAALNVTCPMSTGLGGDAFCLFYDAEQRKVKAINGSGRSPGGMTLEILQEAGYSPSRPLPTTHGLCVTVPGAAAAWIDTVQNCGSGKLSMDDILRPAITLAEEGFPVTEIAAHFWNDGASKLTDPQNTHGVDLLIEGRPPRWGEIFTNRHLAEVLKNLANDGKRGFYEGRVAEAIVDAVRHCGGFMTSEDLANHVTTFEDPISVEYQGVRLWEIPPSGQGIVALMALSILKNFDLTEMVHNSSEYLHLLLEALRIAFSDAEHYVADPAKAAIPVDQLISDQYGAERAKLINRSRANSYISHGNTRMGDDTVYLTVTDAEGNACSFINSNYMGFGTGIVPRGCGFTLQNRGWGFSLEAGHRNVVAPNKRPYHTIIPAMLTDNKTGELLASYGVMGGFMQPQGHVQVLLNMLLFGMEPQRALDVPRFCIGHGHTGAFGAISVEEGITEETVEELRRMGHDIEAVCSGHARSLMGRGHVITRGAWWTGSCEGIHDDRGVWWAGSDPRADGHALGY